ncbi:hypothetical protein [Longimicrobium terrae]|uniref:Cohesin domain-containing protein n=1 Tax=Longimicrobium terrae TaxID=1639882 RepID=A0A841H6X3_9BACT|nr:hypothetical protein [Longimicrobium terrae]MBB4639386.1 hypothetical protein [Longimicrobium terrae]MBB6073693.1 hypothetical protein [Longimicrobium terrae]NNC30638.1 hypothetical protein [Longimicrobium terrae]
MGTGIRSRASRFGTAGLMAMGLSAPAGAAPRAIGEPGALIAERWIGTPLIETRPMETRSAQPRPARQEAGIYPVLVVVDETAAGATVELHLKRVDVAERIASYQGELVYDPAALTVSAGRIPAGITGSWNETRRGTLRFAGVAVAGIEAGPVLTLTVVTTRPLAAEAFRLRMEEVVSATGFGDLAPRLRQDGAHPALSRTRP